MNRNDKESRKRVFESVANYLNSRPKEEFVPGKTWIRYAGRVFDNSEFLSLVDAVLDGWITAGRYTEDFEYQFSNYLGVFSSTLVNSGSSANLIALSSLTSPLLGDMRIKPNDEVITVAAGFPTTVNPIIQNRLVPVFVDIEPDTYNINPRLIKSAISSKTKAIMIAHTLGNPFDIDRVTEICQEHDLYLIEDNCDALGSTYRGRKTGSFGDFSTQSFYPAHHITMGEGGAVNTNDPILERIARSLRDWGRDCYCETGASDTCGMRFTQKFGDLPIGYDHKYVYSHVGYNLKATDLQASIGTAQIKKIDSFVHTRKYNFALLQSSLSKFEEFLTLPRVLPDSDPSWFAFPLTVKEGVGFDRSNIVAFLESRKIMTRSLFAGNLLKHPAYLNVKKRVSGALTVTDNIMRNTFFVGIYPGITDEMMRYVCDTFEEFLSRF